MDYVYKERLKNHPLEFPSSGSIFKAVDGRPAWEYIEKVGLRGFRIGDACIADKHTNFIVNLGHARAVDIKQLIDRIKKEVFEQLGVRLEEEVELWGFDG
jgi:UDP-N-acetylmuramate dehydrogenase